MRALLLGTWRSVLAPLRATALLWVGAMAAACASTPKPFADDGWSEAPDLGRPRPQPTRMMSAPAQEPSTDSTAEPVEVSPLSEEAGTPAALTPTLVGVRHDLWLAPAEAREARCACLAVELAPATSPLFRWSEGQAPDGAGWALAISGQGVPCEGHSRAGRPSIAGVERHGGDLLVEIEELPRGVPLASGVLLPELTAAAHVYVRARSKKLPYARPGRCKLR